MTTLRDHWKGRSNWLPSLCLKFLGTHGAEEALRGERGHMSLRHARARSRVFAFPCAERSVAARRRRGISGSAGVGHAGIALLTESTARWSGGRKASLADGASRGECALAGRIAIDFGGSGGRCSARWVVVVCKGSREGRGVVRVVGIAAAGGHHHVSCCPVCRRCLLRRARKLLEQRRWHVIIEVICEGLERWANVKRSLISRGLSHLPMACCNCSTTVYSLSVSPSYRASVEMCAISRKDHTKLDNRLLSTYSILGPGERSSEIRSSGTAEKAANPLHLERHVTALQYTATNQPPPSPLHYFHHVHARTKRPPPGRPRPPPSRFPPHLCRHRRIPSRRGCKPRRPQEGCP